MIHLLIPVAAKLLTTHLATAHAATLTHATATGVAAHGTAVSTPHAVALAAGKAGSLAGKALATHTGGAVAIGHLAPKLLLPVHVLPFHAVVDATVTTTAIGGVAALNPTVAHAMTKFAEKFVTGYGIARLRREYGGRLDLGSIRRWFRAQSDSDQIPVTVTGTVRDGRFWPAECPEDGPVDVLQGFFNPKTGTLPHARLLRDVQHVSGPLRKSHSGSGMAFYLSENAAPALVA